MIASSHHWILCGLSNVFAYLRIVRIHRDDEIVHCVFENLLTLCVNNIAACGSISILRWFFIVISFGSILYSKVSKSIKFLSSWPILVVDISSSLVSLLLRNNSHWVHQERIIFFKMCWTQNFELQGWAITLFDNLSKHHFSTLGAIIVEIVWLKVFRVEDIESIVWRSVLIILDRLSLHLDVVLLVWNLLWASVTRSLHLRRFIVDGIICRILIRPLHRFLLLDQIFNIFPHRLSQLPIRIKRCILTHWLGIFVVDIHASTTREVSSTHYHSFKLVWIFTFLTLFLPHRILNFLKIL